MKQRHRLLWFGSALWLMSAGAVAWAQDPLPASDAAAETRPLQDPVHKLGRGLTNVLTGWLEIPKQLYLGTQEGNPLMGAGQGLVRGVSRTFLRLGVGVYEAVTFPLPYPKDFASPYERMELPDYAWE